VTASPTRPTHAARRATACRQENGFRDFQKEREVAKRLDTR